MMKIAEGAFFSCEELEEVYYGGSKSDWKKIDITNNKNLDVKSWGCATIHYDYKK